MDEAVLVTGATGLIGSALVRRLAMEGRRVLAAVRDVSKGRTMFAAFGTVEVVRWDVLSTSAPEECGVANRSLALVHAASETASPSFVSRPVETIASIVDGTRNVLEFARREKVRAMVFLSTMEVYGAPTVERVTETDYGPLDPTSVRSSYPESKRLAETLCAAYASEYGVPVKIARLTQTFGPGVRYDDTRVFAEFARAILEGRDIVLKTEGTTARCYCALEDAVEGILTVLEKGAVGMAYTVANEETFCTIREMAQRLIAAHPSSGSKLVVDPSGAGARGFAPPFQMRLDCTRLRALGWEPKIGLLEAYDRMMAGMAGK